MGPVDNVLMQANCKQVSIEKKQLLRDTLSDFHTLIRVMSQKPTLCQQHAPDMPGFIGCCDASLGAGGVWASGK